MALSSENFRAWLEDELLREGWWPTLQGQWLGHDTPLRLLEPAEVPAESAEWVVVALPGEPDPSALERPRTLWVDLQEKRIQGKVVDAPAPLLDAVRRALAEADLHAEPAPGQATRVRRERGTAVLERRMSRGWGGPAVVALLALCLVPSVFGLTRGTDPGTLYCLGASFAPSVKAGQVWRLLSSVFLHGSALHLILNMLFLAVLGVVLERYLGPLRLLVLFVVSGIGGAVASCASHDLMVGMGASGAVYGMAAAFLWLSWAGRALPRRHRPPRPGCLVTFLVLDTLGNLASGEVVDGLQVDLAAHVGGFLTGLVLSPLLVRPAVSPAGLWRAALLGLALLPLPALSLAALNYSRYPTLFDYPEKRYSAAHFSISYPEVLYPTRRKGVNLDAGPGFSVMLFSGKLSPQEAEWSWPADKSKLIEEWGKKQFTIDKAELVPVGKRQWLYLDLSFPDEPTIGGQFAVTFEGNAFYQVGVYTQKSEGGWGRHLLDRSLSTVEPVLWRASYYQGSARGAMTLKRYGLALRSLEYAEMSDPKNFLTYELRRQVYHEMGRAQEALAAADRALALAGKKQQSRALNGRAWTLTRFGQHREALADAQKALDLIPDRGANWANTVDTRGTALLGLKRYAEALRDFEASLAIQSSPGVTYHLGQAMEALGRPSEARAAYQRALKQDHDFEGADDARHRLQRMSP